MNRLHSLCERCTQQLGQFGYGKIEKSTLASCFKFGGKTSTEICFDLRTAEWPQMISCSCRPVGRAEETAILFKFIGVLERQEEFVSEAKRQSLCCFHLFRKGRCE